MDPHITIVLLVRAEPAEAGPHDQTCPKVNTIPT
jgi:hypothetical protein